MVDFRNGAINTRMYQSWSDQIDKEFHHRINHNKKLEAVNERFKTSDHPWAYKFEMQDAEQKLKTSRFKAPTITGLSEKAPSRMRELQELIKTMKSNDGGKEGGKGLATSEMFENKNETERGILFKGISRDREGRYKYLKERQKYLPEQKYPFPITSSMDYGWRYYEQGNINETVIKLNGLDTNVAEDIEIGQHIPSHKFGIKNELHNSFYRSNGVLNDYWKNDTIRVRRT